MARKVRTPGGAKRFGQPIGSTISKDIAPKVGRSAGKVLTRIDAQPATGGNAAKPPTPASTPKAPANATPPKPDAQKAPDVRVHVSEYGMTYRASGADTVADARKLTAEQWATVPVEKISPRKSGIIANEETLKRKHIDKVVAGEPLREGYINQMYRDSDGSLHVVDGHHRVGMYAALDRDDMPVQIVDKATVDKLLGGTSSGDAAAAEKLSTARPKKVRAKAYNPENPNARTNDHPNISPYKLRQFNESTASENRRRIRAFERHNYRHLLLREDPNLQAEIDYMKARVAETESPAQRKRQEDADAAYKAGRKAEHEAAVAQYQQESAVRAKEREARLQNEFDSARKAAELAKDGFYSKTASKSRLESKIAEYTAALEATEGNDNVNTVYHRERLEEKLFKAKNDLRLHASRRRRAKNRRTAQSRMADRTGK